jgi:hypothetical protein
MCHQTTCKKCAKPTWRGCGNHIEQALADVPKSQRCTCRESSAAVKSNMSEGFFARLLGR